MSRKLRNKDLDQIFHRIVNKQAFVYTMKDTLQYYAQCLMCSCRKKSLVRLRKHRKHFYLIKGKQRLDYDLDIVSLLRKIHKLSVIHNVMFDDSDKFMLQVQRM